MLIFAIDDEPEMLERLHRSITEAAPEAALRDFSLGSLALEAIEEQALRPDVIFSDIRMPGVDGLELAARLRHCAPRTRLVFVTGCPEYAVDAYRLHVGGYIMKPADADRIREELDNLFPSPRTEAEGLRVQCFGYFEVYWRGEPLRFARRQTKELFALLIDRRGTSCTAEEMITALWESTDDLKSAKHRIRNLMADLKQTLHNIGMSEVLIRGSGLAALRTDLIDCDYYRMLAGDPEAVNAFSGEYMAQYSWAELTTGKLTFRLNKRDDLFTM